MGGPELGRSRHPEVVTTRRLVQPRLRRQKRPLAMRTDLVRRPDDERPMRTGPAPALPETPRCVSVNRNGPTFFDLR